MKKLQIMTIIVLSTLFLFGFTNKDVRTEMNLEKTYDEIHENIKKTDLRSGKKIRLEDLTSQDYDTLRSQNVNPVFYDFFNAFKSNDFLNLKTTDTDQRIIKETSNTPVYYSTYLKTTYTNFHSVRSESIGGVCLAKYGR